MTDKRKELIERIDKDIFLHILEYKKVYSREVTLQNKVIKVLRQLFKEDIWFSKISDRYNKGIPDIIGCVDGLFFGLELKRETGKPSGLQVHTINKINKAGGKACIVRTVEESLLTIKSMLETSDMQQ